MAESAADKSSLSRPDAAVCSPAALFVATAGYAGYAPIAPGTVGSAIGLVVYVLAARIDAMLLPIVLAVTLFGMGVWAGNQAERKFCAIDPGPVVIDEIMGMLVTLALIPVSASGMLAGFLIFRVLDVVKPYPAARLERLPGGLGIMSDDAVAALYANAALRILIWAVPGLGLALPA